MEGILVSQQIRDLIRTGFVTSADAIRDDQIQPASLDLRLGTRAYRIKAGFLPEKQTVKEKLPPMIEDQLDLAKGQVLQKGLVYLIPLCETLSLPNDLRARSNPKSSTGRLDIFTRVISDNHPRFDDIPAGYRGPLYLEVAPRSFSIRVREGQTLNQLRFFQGDPSFSTPQLQAVYGKHPLVYQDGQPVSTDEIQWNDEGGLFLGIRLKGRQPAGYRARPDAPELDLGQIGGHDPRSYWEPVEAPEGRLYIRPEEFYIFASKEQICVPPDIAAEMLPYDVGMGELRTNYAGFFDNGFGYRPGGRPGTPAVLEVRAHDVPFLIEDGQVFFQINFFRTMGSPEFLYGDPRAGSSYGDQDLTLAKQFRPIE